MCLFQWSLWVGFGIPGVSGVLGVGVVLVWVGVGVPIVSGVPRVRLVMVRVRVGYG